MEEATGPPFEVWPENWAAVMAFEAMATQWRMGPGGPIGLDYGVLRDVFALMDIKCDRSVFDDVRVMEDAALKLMHEERNK